MNDDRKSPPVGPDKSSNESSPLLRNAYSSRPYQAYCVTEASSRPSSPDALKPRPLRIGTSLPPIRSNEPRTLLGTSWAPSKPGSIEQGGSFAAVVSGLESEDGGKAEHSNERPALRSTMLANSNHITQAATPRGSHTLPGNLPTMYDRAPSQLRMQRATPEHVATTSTHRRKPSPQHAVNTIMVHRPLPPLPLEVAPSRALYDPRERAHDTDPDEADLEQACRLPVQLDGEPHTKSHGTLQIFPKAEIIHTHGAAEIRSSGPMRIANRIEDAQRSSESLTSQKYTTSSSTCTTHGGHAQWPSSPELYEPRGLYSKMDDDRRAVRRTQPKDAKFKYQFGRRPSVRLDKPLPSPLDQHVPNPSISIDAPSTASTQEADDHFHFDNRSPSPSTSTIATKAGPRPPPWGSTDNLELRRQSRSEAREREEARRYRMTIDSGSSIYKGSGSTDSLRQNTMRREVEEYREQVLQLYPDMAFDGNAGKGGRSCLCVVM